MKKNTSKKTTSRKTPSTKAAARKGKAETAPPGPGAGRRGVQERRPLEIGSFEAIVGHRRTIDHLKHLLVADRVPHALLLVGEEGIGKFRVAMQLGRARLCQERVDDACGVCLDCRLGAAGEHADLHVMDRPGALNLSIDEVRAWIEASNQKPFRARGRTLVLRDAHRLTTEAQNALLKRLEEPPPECVQILTTSHSEGLVSTIRSRCRELRLQPLTPLETAQVLEKSDCDPARVALLASASGGSPGKALALDQGGFLVFREPLLDLVSGNVTDPLALVKAIMEKVRGKDEGVRYRSRILVEMWITLLRDVLVSRIGASDDILVHQDLATQVATAARFRPETELLACCEAGRAAMKSLDVNALPELVVSVFALGVVPEAGNPCREMSPGRDLH